MMPTFFNISRMFEKDTISANAPVAAGAAATLGALA
jgi:hypothetical protein